MNNQKKKETKKRGRPSTKCTKGESEWLRYKKQEEKDACDCFVAECPGCWYPCETCGSNKCSTFCRLNERDEQLEWKFFD